MRTRNVHRTIAPAVVAITAALVLAACSGTASEQAYAPVPGVVSDEAFAVTGESAAGGPGVTDTGVGTVAPQLREVIRTAFVSMRVEDVAQATTDLHALVTQRNGLIASEDAQVSGESDYATITAQVPARELDAFIAAVSALGTVDSVSVTAQDVTTQVVDLDARVSALKASIDRMSVLLARAQRIEDLLAIETQISTRQAELDSLVAQRTWLGDQVAMSSVTVSMSPSTAPVPDIEAPGFLSGLRNGWATFTSAIALAVTALGFGLPFAIMLLIVLLPLGAIAIRQARRRRPASTVTDDRETVGM